MVLVVSPGFVSGYTVWQRPDESTAETGRHDRERSAWEDDEQTIPADDGG
jgi:hypothetical protein